MIHIMPLDDLHEHTTSVTCLCGPRVDYNEGEGIAVHNSWDGREAIECFENAVPCDWYYADKQRKENECH